MPPPFTNTVQEWRNGCTPGLDGPGDTHPPVTHDGDDNHGDEEDQGSRRGADDEWQLLLDAGLVLGWGESARRVLSLAPGALTAQRPAGSPGIPGSVLLLTESLSHAQVENWLSLAHKLPWTRP